MDESDPRVEYRKQVALKLNYIVTIQPNHY
jgi:hypothetical protein